MSRLKHTLAASAIAASALAACPAGAIADDGTKNAVGATAAAAAEAAVVGVNVARTGVIGGMLAPTSTATQAQEDKAIEEHHQNQQRQTYGGYTPSIESMQDGRR